MRGARVWALAATVLCSGLAAAKPEPRTPPTQAGVRLGSVAAGNDATRPIAQRIETAYLAGLSDCYRRAVARAPILVVAGASPMTLTVGAGGRVDKAGFGSGDPGLDRCWRAATRKWRFDRGPATTLTTSLIFLADDGTPLGGDPLGSLEPPPPTNATQPQFQLVVGAVASSNEKLMPASLADRVIRQRYLAGLSDCFRNDVSTQRNLAFDGQIKLTVTGNGRVSRLDITGTSDPLLRRCWDDAVRNWLFAEKGTSGAVVLTVPVHYDKPPQNLGIGPHPDEGPRELAPPPPVVTIGKVESDDETTFPAKPAARRLQSVYLPPIKRCYRQAQSANPLLEVKGQLELAINTQGRVSHVEVSGFREGGLEACLAGAAKYWRFDAPSGGDEHILTAAVSFKPAR